jgi:hypothetical protein
MAPPAADGAGCGTPENLTSVKFAQVSRGTTLPPLPFDRRLGVGIIVWCVLFAIVVFFAFVATRMAAQNKEDGLHDTGLAIIEFGRAFPTEAIRQLQATENGQAIFVRLHDNKAGFMRNMSRHFACHLIEPGRVRVVGSETGRGLAIDFLDAPHHNGDFEFASAKEASEVSLWLLGNYIAEPDKDLPSGNLPAANKQ